MDGPEIFRQTQLEQQVIVSNYRETKCPGLKLEPKELLVRDIDRGLIPYGIPEWEGEQEDRVLTIRPVFYSQRHSLLGRSSTGGASRTIFGRRLQNVVPRS
jgi:hypothetical protein